MEDCEDVRFKQSAVIEFLIAEKKSFDRIHRRMHTVYGNKCVDVSTDVGYGGLSKMCWGKQVCVTKHCRGGQ